MSHPYKPAITGHAGTVTTGFRPLPSDAAWDHQPIYKIVEVGRDGNGRLRREGRVWHNDLEMLRKFGRAVAANTSSHKVLITDSFGDIIEELPVASPETRRAAWDTWGGTVLPPAPPRPPRRVEAKPKPVPVPAKPVSETPPAAPANVPVVHAEPAAAAASAAAAPASADALTFPPRDVPQLPLAQADGTDAADANPVAPGELPAPDTLP